MTDYDPTGTLDRVGLTEYEECALTELFALGRTTAPTLAEATGIPKARIYGVLDALADRGFVKVIPERPKRYQPRSPAAIVERAVENRRQEYEGFRADLDDRHEAFLDEFEPRYERSSEDISPAEELFSVVDVGEPSEAETRRLYHEARSQIRIISKSFEYLDTVEPALAAALEQGIDVDVLMLHPDNLSTDNAAIQADIVERLRAEFSGVGLRFSTEALPWRGTLADPSKDYETGTAILLVQEDEVPNHLRQAAITENGSFVAGLQRYFELIWEYESIDVTAV
jgi:sugar-specific transcriptional regulator TrmB